ncbi:DUF2642 domain-containing protein [Bacillus sp. SCS-153A]|uniref:DUF2642 domain-containing protein n=1 Tax=Rossellomorea sedimentorum TaxID=3115294 RepID=UPI003905F83F
MYCFRINPQNEMLMTMPVTQPAMQSQPVFNFEPYVYQFLQSVIGKGLIVSTVRDTLRGKLMDAKPNHIVLNIGDKTFFTDLPDCQCDA